MAEGEIKDLCLAHGRQIAAMESTLSATHEGVIKLNDKVDKIVLDHEGRISSLETTKKEQPSAKTMMGICFLGAAVVILLIVLGGGPGAIAKLIIF